MSHVSIMFCLPRDVASLRVSFSFDFFPFLSFSWFSMWLTVCMLITIVLHSVMYTRDLYAKHKMCWPQAKLVVDNYIKLLRTYCGCIIVISFVDYLTACYMNSLKFFRHIKSLKSFINELGNFQFSACKFPLATCLVVLH